jgi:hypothetical protein
MFLSVFLQRHHILLLTYNHWRLVHNLWWWICSWLRPWKSFLYKNLPLLRLNGDRPSRYIRTCFNSACGCLGRAAWRRLILLILDEVLSFVLRCPTHVRRLLKLLALTIEVLIVKFSLLLGHIARRQSQLFFIFLELTFEAYLGHPARLVPNFHSDVNDDLPLIRRGVPSEGDFKPSLDPWWLHTSVANWLRDVMSLFTWGPIPLRWAFIGLAWGRPATLLSWLITEWLVWIVLQLTLFGGKLIRVLVFWDHSAQHYHVAHRLRRLLPTF